MTESEHNKLAAKPHHKPWVGVLAAFFLTGAAHFLAGRRAAGLKWFLGILLLQSLHDWFLASHLVPGLIPGLALALITLALWIVMLVKSWRPIPRICFRGWAGFVVVAGIIALLQSQFSDLIARPFRVPTNTMAPTIQGGVWQPDGSSAGGDRVFAEMSAYWFNKPQRGDIVVFKTAGISYLPADQFYVKRVIGIPGDVLSVEDGRLLNHGQPVEEPAVLARLYITNHLMVTPEFLGGSNNNVAVPLGHYFVVGDNTANSFDSRFWGPVSEKNIIGRVSKIYWPLSRAGSIE